MVPCKAIPNQYATYNCITFLRGNPRSWLPQWVDKSGLVSACKGTISFILSCDESELLAFAHSGLPLIA
jgi:hypothetical protein